MGDSPVLRFPEERNYKVGDKIEIQVLVDTHSLIGTSTNVTLVETDGKIVRHGLVSNSPLKIYNNAITFRLTINALGDKGPGEYQIRFDLAGVSIFSPNINISQPN